MKPPFPYFGGKSGMASKIAALLPPHEIYIEPYAGSLAVLFAKEPVTHEFVNDVDGALTTFFKVLRDRPEELATACQLTPYSRREFELAVLDDAVPMSELELARRFWVRVNQSFAKTAGLVTGWSVTIGRTQATAVDVQNRIRRFLVCAERLSFVTIENKPAIDVIERLGHRPNTVIYLDPPYLGSVRSHGSSSSVEYRFDMAGDQPHLDLAEVVHSTPARVVLSGYPSELYEKLYGDWWYTDFAVTAHSSNARKSSRTGRTERVWANFEPHTGRMFHD